MTIKDKIPVTELLAGLAEEATELAQAALKLRRVFDGTNPTPVTEVEATDRLYEEIADTALYLDMLDYNHQTIEQLKEEKLRRWEKRLGLTDAGR